MLGPVDFMVVVCYVLILRKFPSMLVVNQQNPNYWVFGLCGCFCSFRNKGRRTMSRTPVLLSVIQYTPSSEPFRITPASHPSVLRNTIATRRKRSWSRSPKTNPSSSPHLYLLGVALKDLHTGTTLPLFTAVFRN
jgi:hypothetical protein